MMQPDDPIYVAGHRGLVGSAICRALDRAGYENVITRASGEADLRDRDTVDELFQAERPRYVFLAAARVGGIQANIDYPGQFIHDNLAIQTNVIDACRRYDVAKLLFLGSNCIYPRLAENPVREDSLMTGLLEPTNEAYAVAKIAGLVMCRSYAREYGLRSVIPMPCNLYGPGDNYDLATSHVVPALIRKFHEARDGGQVEVWGSGTPRRECLHADDLAEACLFLMDRHESPDPVNVGAGYDVSITELAELVRKVTGSKAEIVYDLSKPDGTARKLLDTSRITELGWTPRISLEDGLTLAYRWYREHGAGTA